MANTASDEGSVPEAYAYDLPEARIAQRPCVPYDRAKLLAVKRLESKLEDYAFTDICKFLSPDDLLVFNDTRVIPARLFGKLSSGKEIELLLVNKKGEDQWECIGRPLKKLTEGTEIKISNSLSAKVIERIGEMRILVSFSFAADSFNEALEENGVMPIPPYIRKGRADSQDTEDYQTHFAKTEGSIAAPTASLHFTPELMESIREYGCSFAELTLHVGTASFLPLWKEGDKAIKAPGSEVFEYGPELLDLCKKTKDSGGRVIAVGTTVVRALESIAREKKGSTELFIKPGFEFRLVDGIVTNFHQPRTTHLLLVEAFLGRDLLDKSYQHALISDYRFLSYGDGMFLY